MSLNENLQPQSNEQAPTVLGIVSVIMAPVGWLVFCGCGVLGLSFIAYGCWVLGIVLGIVGVAVDKQGVARGLNYGGIAANALSCLAVCLLVVILVVLYGAAIFGLVGLSVLSEM